MNSKPPWILQESTQHRHRLDKLRTFQLFSSKIYFVLQVYTVISNKVVGMLIRARRHGLVHFTGEMLYQGQDDDKIIMLLELPKASFATLGLDSEGKERKGKEGKS